MGLEGGSRRLTTEERAVRRGFVLFDAGSMLLGGTVHKIPGAVVEGMEGSCVMVMQKGESVSIAFGI